MVEEGVRCPICQVVADPLGDHQVGCEGNGDRIHRHDSVRDALFSAAQTAALAPRKEVPSLIPGTSSRPADVYISNWMRGQPAALDVHVISTLQQLTLKEVGVRRQLSPSRTLDSFRSSDWEFPPPKPLDTFFSGWPSTCGGATPPSGSAASPLDRRRWTG